MNDPVPTVLTIPLGHVNVFVLCGTRPVLVDAGYPGSAEAILVGLARHNVAPDEISLTLITHGHADHFGGAAELRTRIKAPVAMHEADAEVARQGVNPSFAASTFSEKIWARRLSKGTEEPHPVEPDILFDKTLDLTPYGVAGRAISTPGHTPGSISIVLDGGSVIVGDLLMGDLLFTKQPNYPFIIDNGADLNDSIRTVLKLEPKVIYASHGGPFAPDKVRKRFPWIGR